MTKLILDASALERLIGGDSEAEVQLRQSVVEEFGKRHLRAVANNGQFLAMINRTLNDVADALKEEVRREIGTFTKDGWGKVTSVKLQKHIDDFIHDQIRGMIYDSIEKKIKDTIDRYYNDSYIQDAVRRRLEVLTNDEIRKQVDVRFAAALAALK